MTLASRHPDRRSHSRALAAVAGLLALLVPSCGGDSASFPPTLVTSTVFEFNSAFTDLARFGISTADFTVPEAGTLDIVVDWSSSVDDVDIVLSNPACDAVGFAAGICKVLGSERTNVKPARLTLGTTATSYRLFVVNLGPERESGTVSVRVLQGRISF